MADLVAISEGLAANLETIPGLQESPYMLSNPTLPAAEIVPGPIDYDQVVSRGHAELTFIVRVMVGAVGDIGPQKRLLRLMSTSGSESVSEALESDTTLGGACEDLRVGECSGFRRYRENRALGAEWTVFIIATP